MRNLWGSRRIQVANGQWASLFFLLLSSFGFACSTASAVEPRLPNRTLRLPQAPPSFGFATTNAFGTLSFPNPLAITAPPGETNRLFVVEQRGIVSVITNLAAPNRTIFLDISSRVVGGTPPDERGLLGLAFHPGYATNRYFFIFYSLNATTAAGSGSHQRLARFEASPADPGKALPASEVPLITQRDSAGNHNGGDLHFGPDGYLYVSLGDEGNQYDSFNNSQRIDKNFFSAILRLDVDKKPGNLPSNLHASTSTNYFVPADNPFVGATSFNGVVVDPTRVRTEFFAVGFRNPWRFSFDPLTGLLYCGDVGQDTWEEVDVVTKGGNYGWAYREGLHAGPRTPSGPAASVPFINPIAEYRHGSATNQGNSVTGGVVYRGDDLSQLWGHYVFADYVSGHIWALRYDGSGPSPFRRLTADAGIAAFGTDPRNGAILIADQSDDRIKTLVYTSTATGPALPPSLADTGAFADLTALQPNPGIVPYDLNLSFWSDNARKSRWFTLPDTNLFIGFSRTGNWAFPTGMVWIKHFDLELTNGSPASRRRLETRFIVRNSAGVYGITYRWDDAQTNAFLVPEDGLDETFSIQDQGTVRTQVWHYPSRTECLRCHTAAGGFAIGFNTPQLNREIENGGAPTNQLLALYHAGYLQTNPAPVNLLPRLAPPDDPAVSREYRVRSWLAANCVQCHQPGGEGVGLFDARLTTPLSAANILDGPLLNTLGNPSSRVIKAGSLDQSMLLQRIATPGAGRMPPIDSNLIDTQAVALVSSWITNDLPAASSLPEWLSRHFTNAEPAALLADPDQDGAPNFLEYLTSTDPLNPGQRWTISAHAEPDLLVVTFPHLANRGFDLQTSANPFDPASWTSLDDPDNRPLISATNFETRIAVPLTNSPARFYRVRVYEP